MKGTLIKVNEGIVFTIDERPKIGDCYLSISKRMAQRFHKDDSFFSNQHKILASTFGVGLELQAPIFVIFIPIEYDTEYNYKIEDGKVIIEL